MRLSELLTPALIKIGIESEDKDALFEEMVHVFVSAGHLADRQAAVQALRTREAKMSTGIAPGLAITHGKLEGIRGTLLSIGTSHQGIEYGSLDGKPVHVVLMVFAEAGNPGPHIEVLAEASRLFFIPGFTERIRGARTSAEVLQAIRAEE